MRPVERSELVQVLEIATRGLLDVKLEARHVVGLLGDKWDRADLAKVVDGIERLEEQRVQEVSSRVGLYEWTD